MLIPRSLQSVRQVVKRAHLQRLEHLHDAHRLAPTPVLVPAVLVLLVLALGLLAELRRGIPGQLTLHEAARQTIAARFFAAYATDAGVCLPLRLKQGRKTRPIPVVAPADNPTAGFSLLRQSWPDRGKPDLVIFDELGYLPFSASGGALLIRTDRARLPVSQTMIDRDGHLSYR